MTPLMTLLLAGGAAVICVGGLLYALFARTFEDDARRKQRFAAVEGPAAATAAAGPSAQARAQQRIKDLRDRERRRGQIQFKDRLEQAGLRTTPWNFLAIFYALAAVAGGAVIALGQPPLVAAPVAVAVAFGLPQLVLKKLIARRQAQFIKHFANAIDILVRGVRSGLPINECLKLIANEIPDPVRTEFSRLTEMLAVGVSFEDALNKLLTRMPTAEVNFFVTVLIIQRQTGGNLADALGNLSNILRDRRKLKGKIAALSSEARSSAMIIGSLPFVVSGLIYLVAPHYLMPLFTTADGNVLLGAALVWMSLGVLTMRAMINFEV